VDHFSTDIILFLDPFYFNKNIQTNYW